MVGVNAINAQSAHLWQIHSKDVDKARNSVKTQCLQQNSCWVYFFPLFSPSGELVGRFKLIITVCFCFLFCQVSFLTMCSCSETLVNMSTISGSKPQELQSRNGAQTASIPAQTSTGNQNFGNNQTRLSSKMPACSG